MRHLRFQRNAGTEIRLFLILGALADGLVLEGAHVRHAWTEPGDYEVQLSAKGLSGETTDQTLRIHIAGYMSTIFAPESNRRYAAPQ